MQKSLLYPNGSNYDTFAKHLKKYTKVATIENFRRRSKDYSIALDNMLYQNGTSLQKKSNKISAVCIKVQPSSR